MRENIVTNENEIKKFANNMRINMIEMMKKAGANGAHIGGALSCTEILACLYSSFLNVYPIDPLNSNRDRFVLSKGHVALALYSALYETGFITKEELLSFEENESHFGTHCSKYQEKGVELSSGSLGLGLSYGCGCALMAKINNLSYDTFVLVGDGETNEGSVWEAVQSCAKFNLDNLILIIDINKQSLDGWTKDVMPVFDYETVFRGFGWNTVSVNGNNINEICNAINSIKRNGRPTVILANTLKGYGVSFIENQTGWHHARLTDEQYETALKELGA